MRITKEWLQAKRSDYERQLTNAVALVNNINGAIQATDFLIQDIDLPEITVEENKAKSEGKTNEIENIQNPSS